MQYGEKLLDASGERIEWGLWDGPGAEVLWTGEVRLAFLFGYLNAARRMITPFGEVQLPAPSARPARLARITYESP